MEKYNISNTNNGWFIGDFPKAIMRTKEFEANCKKFSKGEKTDNHFHKIAKEINLIAKGAAEANGQKCKEGDIIVVNPNESLQWYFLEDTILFTIKTPSVPGDKYPKI